MHPFWESFVRPILLAIEPRSIVEIGSENGFSTRHLIEFCQAHEVEFHAIDPEPNFDVEACAKEHARFVFHRSLSLEVLGTIDRFDAVLIDGDHNWHTVFHELKLIEQRSNELDQPFPIVILHDVEWPYGRRDMYYDPSTIPESYRNPYERKGMWPGESPLRNRGGLSPHLCNATHEKGPRNGVLTAIEDFLAETALELELIRIPGYAGLAILYRRQLPADNRALGEFLETLALPPAVEEHIRRLEQNRITLLIEVLERRQAMRQAGRHRGPTVTPPRTR